MKTRKHPILSLAAVLILSSLFSGCSSKETTIHYGGQLYAQEILLQRMDVWSAYNVNIEHVLFTNPDDLVEGFRKGVVDIALFSDIQAAQLFNEFGEDIVIIATAESGDRITTLVRVDSRIEDWDDLENKNVALRSGSGAELVLKRYFDQHKLDWDSIEWFNIPVDDMPAALADGAVDAITALEPIPAMAQAAGGMRVMQSYGECCPAPMVLVTKASFARARSEEISAFLRGHLDKLGLIESDSALAARTAAKQAKVYGLDISASAFHIVFKRVDFSLLISKNIISALENTAQAMIDAGTLEDIPEYYFDDSYLEAALLDMAAEDI